MWHNFAKNVRELQWNFGEGSGSYRPDLHYMRGPGPKWHAKYGTLAPKTSPTAAPTSREECDQTERYASRCSQIGSQSRHSESQTHASLTNHSCVARHSRQ